MGFPNEDENDYPNYNDEDIPIGSVKIDKANYSYENLEFRERLKK